MTGNRRRTSMSRRVALSAGVIAAVVGLVAASVPAASGATRADDKSPKPHDGMSAQGQQTLHNYAAATWQSFVAMVDPASGLPADKLGVDGTRSVETSTTNIGAYMWSTLVAERLNIIGNAEGVARLSRTIS